MKRLNPPRLLNSNLIRLFLTFVLAISLTQTVLANSSKLVGHWVGGGLNITIKANHTYKYKMLKIISVGGNWSANKNTLTLNYSSFGKKKKKVATYHFKGKNLVLRMKGKKAVTLKKQ